MTRDPADSTPEPDTLDTARLRLMAERQAAAYARMVELGGGIGQLGCDEPEMYRHMVEWMDTFEYGRVDTVVALLDEIARLTERLEVRGDIDMTHTIHYLRNGYGHVDPTANVVLHYMHAAAIADQLERTFLPATEPVS